jgi:hypothetical protein
MKIHSQSLIIDFSFLAKSSDPPRRKDTMRGKKLVKNTKRNTLWKSVNKNYDANNPCSRSFVFFEI